MNSRIPTYVLGLLVLVALVWRVANPPAPPVPGPLGQLPHWDSTTKSGDMGPSAVNPSGTMWAGAWNKKAKDGKFHSGVWVIDFQKAEARSSDLGVGSFVPSLTWFDDNEVRALVNESDAPNAKSKIVSIDATTGKSEEKPGTMAGNYAGVFAWPANANKIGVALADGSSVDRVAVITDKTEAVANPINVKLTGKFLPQNIAAISPDGNRFVFPVSEDKIGSDVRYYLGDAKTAIVNPIFKSTDLPGRVAGLWVSPAGVLIVCAERNDYHRMVYNPALGKITELKQDAKDIDVAKSWPDAPKDMMFATYSAGYDFDLATGKKKQIFDLSKLDKKSGYWREQIQDGRLYPKTGGGYTCVSYMGNLVDIRELKKNGDQGQGLLVRR